ncbi:inner-membrane translocator [Ignisphaera aggregans DSM 17230]|uniref:Inner-membrane translocator n=1 Tax=Ignisphaera aggregans (strain DSM 17230 / JCM 13409 / AQ1.S1) TaxID=583356 RepID=E0STS5_IGNAA|nr:inner-membrane translocator [Ignisphaera aggregans DSM 17230]
MYTASILGVIKAYIFDANNPYRDKAMSMLRRIVVEPVFGISLAIAVIAFVTGAVNPNFWTVENWEAILRWIIALSVMAMGESFVLISGGIDLSVGSIAAASGMVLAYLIHCIGIPIPISIFLTLLFGLSIGLFHGAFVSILSPPFPQIMPAFLITLVSKIFFGGFAQAITLGWPIVLHQYRALALVSTTPILVTILLITAILSIYIQRFSILGRYVYAVGGNIDVARISGVPINKVRLFVYGYSGVCAALAGVINTSLMMTAYPGTGLGMELFAIASNAVGGVSLAGGEGMALGAIIGSFLIGLIRNSLVLTGVSPYWIESVTGIILAVAVVTDLYRRLRIR